VFRFARFETRRLQCTDAFLDLYLSDVLSGLRFDQLQQST
jgi:hypothetical protein